MAYTTINKPTDYFNTVLYTGNGSTQSITGVGFQPDWIWVKSRSGAFNHEVIDVVRGGGVGIFPNLTNAESSGRSLSAFTSDGFTLSGSDTTSNNNGSTYASWNWLADNTSGSSNTDGSITSTVSANTTSGFSIVSYTGTGSSTTVGHGLGVAPSFLIFKNRDTTDSWNVQSDGLTSYDYYVRLNSTGAENNDIDVGNSAPTSTFVSVGSHPQQNGNGNDMILYAFAEKKGFSKFGSYTGNGNADGTFVYTGFKPAFVLTKASSDTKDWVLLDNKRDSFNLMNKKLFSNNSDAEYSGQNACDFLSNGFKLRDNATNAFAINDSGRTQIYMAFAENPFTTSTGIPTTAR